MASELRKTGISIIGDMPWGAHFCYFYETKQDLLDILVPYFKTGLENKEFCLWVISNSELLTVQEATSALRNALHDLDRYVAERSIEVVGHDDWFLNGETFDLHKVANRFKEKLNEASARGYAGMRINGSPAWLHDEGQKELRTFEEELDKLFPNERIIASCTYPLAAIGGDEIFDVARTHQFAIARRQGEWEVIETPALIQAKQEIRRLNEELEQRVIERTNELRVVNEELRKEITDRKQIERELRESQQQYESLVHSIDGIVWEVNAETFRFNFVSKQAERILGYPLAQWLEPNFWADHLHPDDCDWAVGFCVDATQRRVDHQFEYRMIAATGRVVWLRDLVTVHVMEDQSVRLRGVMFDITERKEAEERLKQSERRLAEAQRIAHIGSWSWDLNSKAQIWSVELYRIYGLQPGKIAPTYEAFLELVHPEDRLLLGESGERAIRTQEPIDLYFRIVRPDGEERIINSRGRIVYDEQGNPIRKFGTAQDVTEYRRSEEALRAAEQKYRDIFENAVEGIFQTTPDGTFVAANPALARMLGFDSPEELMSTRTDIAQEHYVDPKSREEFKRSMEENGFVLDFELEAYRKDRSKIWISENVRAVRDEHGPVLYYEGTAVDITDRKRAETRSAAFANLAHKLSGAWTPLDAGRIIAETADELFGWDSCTLDLYDAQHDVIHSMLAMDMIDGQRVSVTPLVSGGRPTPRSKRVIVHGPELILREEPFKFDEDAVPIGDTSRPSATLMTAPIRHASRVIGILSFQSYTPRAYDDVAFSDLQALSDHCGEALNRLQAENQLQESEERYRDLVENSLELICTHDLDGLILSGNRAAMEIMGYRSGSYPAGTNLREILAPEVREQFDDYLIRIRADGVASGLMLVETRTGEKRIWEYHNTLRTQGVSAPIVRGMARDITERKLIEEKLRQSESQLAEAQRLASVGSWNWDIRNNTHTWSDELYRIYGLHPREYAPSYEAFIERVHPEDSADISQAVEHSLKTQEPINSYLRMIRPDGAERIIHSRGNTISDISGTPIRMHGTVQDVTARKHAESALRESQARTQLLVKSSNIGLWDWNLVTNEVFFSPEWKSQLGYADHELDNRYEEWENRLHPEDREPTLRAVKDFREGRRADYDVKFHLRHKDGSYRRILTQAQVFRDASNKPVRMMGCHIDITERRQAEEALRESEERYRELFENAKDATFVHDLNGKYTSVNRAAEKLTGYTRAEILGKSFSHFVPPEQIEHIRKYGRKLVDEGETSYESEVTTKDGRRVAVEVSSHVILENGVPVAVQGTARDITQRKAAEEKLKANSEQLRALSARLQSAREEEGTRIAREIHDELGSVLTSLKWDLEGTDRILANPMEPSQLAALRERLRALMKLSDLAIEAIRRIASELRPSVLDDLGLLAAIEWQAQQFQARTGIVCFCDCSLEKVELNEEQSTAVFRILQEALTNVIRHAQATRVDIKINKENGYFTLSISDNGKGITESAKSEQQSLGILGMRERAHLIGGEIDIKGVEGKGTMVIVRVPVSGQDRVLKMTR